jgi:hypothetical protein
MSYNDWIRNADPPMHRHHDFRSRKGYYHVYYRKIAANIRLAGSGAGIVQVKGQGDVRHTRRENHGRHEQMQCAVRRTYIFPDSTNS